MGKPMIGYAQHYMGVCLAAMLTSESVQVDNSIYKNWVIYENKKLNSVMIDAGSRFDQPT